MHPMELAERWRHGADRARAARPRVRVSSQQDFWRGLANVLTPESFFRLILAFVLSTALWLYVTSRNAPEASFPYGTPIPITAEDLPRNLTLTSTLPPIHIDVRPQSIGVQSSTFIPTVDLSGYHAGRHRHVPVSFNPPPGTVTNWTPKSVSLVLERVISRELPVHINELNAPPYGFTALPNGMSASPRAVEITGAASYVDQVAKVLVPLDLTQARSSINVDSVPILESAQGRQIRNGVSVIPARVRVHAAIKQVATFKTLPILATIDGQPAAGFGVSSLSVSPPGLTAYGPPKALNGLQNLRTTSVSIKGLRYGKRTFTARLTHPSGVYFKTRFVKVTVVIGPVTGEAVTRVAVRTKNNPGNEIVAVKPTQLAVSITGPIPKLSSAGRHLAAVIDLARLRPGAYSIAPRIEGAAKVTIVSVEPPRVSVTIRRR